VLKRQDLDRQLSEREVLQRINELLDPTRSLDSSFKSLFICIIAAENQRKKELKS
jgi:hypothetical protein